MFLFEPKFQMHSLKYLIHVIVVQNHLVKRIPNILLSAMYTRINIKDALWLQYQLWQTVIVKWNWLQRVTKYASFSPTSI